nr:aspartyl/asparaginyl beta-hydroxylase domain-containing protein [Rhizorhabdus phycosphaerae]
MHLWQYGRRIAANARHCPGTMALIERFPQPRIGGCSPNAMFSLLARTRAFRRTMASPTRGSSATCP